MLENYSNLLLFKDFSADEFELLEPLFNVCQFMKEDVIFEQGECAETFYLLIDGSVRILFKPYDGPEIILTRLQPGSLFGWSALIGSEQYTSTTVCETASKTICIRGADLRELCFKHPDIGSSILDRLALMVTNRWQDAQEQVRDIIRKSVSEQSQNAPQGELKMEDLNYSMEDQIKGLLEQISAYVEQYHGGSVEFISLHDNVLKVRLGGACLGCPLLPATLQGWVAGTVHQFFPEVEIVEA